jgi:hypothetical protein
MLLHWYKLLILIAFLVLDLFVPGKWFPKEKVQYLFRKEAELFINSFRDLYLINAPFKNNSIWFLYKTNLARLSLNGSSLLYR